MKSVPKRLWIVLVLVCFAGILKATLPPIIVGSWTATSSLTQARSNGSAVLLSNGRILFTGGDSGSGQVQSAEYFAADGTVSSAAAMNYPRSSHFAVVLSDGRVLVGGGNSSGGGTTNSAEIYDPTSDSWSKTGTMAEARANATAALLQDGRVVIAGGDNAGAPSNTIEIYDPSSGSFSVVSQTLSSSRTKHAMAVLQDGRVLIAGGFDANNPLASSDIFDPSSDNVSAGPNLATARYSASATTLLNGQVAVIGGAGSDGNGGTTDLASIEIFNPDTNAFHPAGASLATAREGHQAYLLPNNNNVLITGGTAGGTALASAELFTAQASAVDGSWSYAVSATGAMTTARAGASGSANQKNGPTSDVTPRPGLVIVGGGTDASGATLASTEAYGYPTVQSDKGDYPPGTTVKITGSGFNPGETVNISLVESPLFDTHGPYTVTADGNGNISDSSFITDAHDENIRFFLSAVGSQSGAVAQNSFTDSANKSIFSDGQNTIPTTNFGSITANQCRSSSIVALQGSNLGTVPVNSSASFSSAPAGANFFAGAGCTGTSVTSIAVPTNASFAAFSFKIPSSGSYTITGVGSWDTGGAGNDASATVTVTAPTNTTTTLGSSANPSTYGDSVTFTATITPNVGASGTVDFKDGASTICSAKAVSGSVATCSTPSLSATSHSITAVYSGGGTFAGSTSNTVTQNVNPKALTYSGLSVPASKVYDDTTGAVVSGTASLQAAEILGSGTSTDRKPYTADSVSLTGTPTATYDSKDVPTATKVTFGGLSLTGGGSTNYTLTASTQAATITQKPLTYSGLSVPASRIYDGTTNAVVSGTATLLTAEAAGSGTASDGKPFTGDNLSLTGTATGTYNSKDVATATTVTVGGISLGGTAGGNYTLTALTQAATITAKPLTYSGLSVPASRIYDGTTNAVISGTATLHATEAAGAGSTADGTPYSVDSVSLTGTATAAYNTKDVATANLVTVGGISLTGTGSGNYTLTASSQPATITPKALTYTGLTVPASRAYDATTVAVVSGSASLQTAEAPGGSTSDGKPYTGDTVSLIGTPTGTYDSKDVASATIVTFGGISLTGTGNGNYTLTPLTQAATITPKALTYTGLTVPASRAYDATTVAVVSGSASLQTAEAPGGSTADGKPYTGDTVSLTGTATAAYNTKDVASATIVTFGGISLTGTGNGNYTLTALTQAATITPKALTYTGVSVPASRPYDGTTNAVVSGSATLQTAEAVGAGNSSDSKPYAGDTVSVTGTITAMYNSKNVSAANLVTFAGASLTGGDSGDYTLTALTQAATITPATLTYTANPATRPYGGTDPAFSGTVGGFITGENQGNATTGTLAFATTADAHSNVGNYPINGSGLTANYGNYVFVQAASNATALTITKADATVVVTPYSVTYDGNAHTATGAATGVFGETLTLLDLTATTHTNAGTYYDKWTFTDSTGNYKDASATIKDVIKQATPVVTVTDPMPTFDGGPHMATAVAKGIGGATVSGTFTFTYDGSAVAPTNAKTSYAVVATFTSSDANYTDASGNGTLTINQATPVVTVTDQMPTFDGSPHMATAVAKGIGGVTVSGTFTFTYDGSAVAPTNAKSSYAVVATFTSTDTNYTGASGNGTLTIKQATPVVTVTDPMPTFDGNPHMATAVAKGIGGVTVSGSFSFTYDGSATAPTDAKTSYAVVATFTSTDTNYTGATGNGTLTIKQATPVVTVTDPMPTYDGNPHMATATAKGLGGVTVSGTFSFTYDGSATAPTDAKTSYAVVATFTSTDTNYTGATGNGTLTIKQATPVVTVTDPMPTYDGNPHMATATAKGLGGVTVSGTFSFTYDGSATAPTDAKTSYAVVATFTSTDTNYTGATGNGTLTIKQATPVVTVTDPMPTYDGNPHMATATAKGLGGVTVSGTFSFTYDGSATAPTDAKTSYAVVATFTSTDTNYTGATGNGTLTIKQAPSTTTITPSAVNVIYNGAAHGVTATVTGAGGLNQSVPVTYTPGGSTAPLNPGTYTANASYAGDVNHLPSSATQVNITIAFNTTCAAGPGDAILPPINNDGSSVYKRQGGSTIPVKFRVCDAAGNAISNASLVFAPNVGSVSMLNAARGTVDNVNETPYVDVADSGFRWDSSGQQWIFNMATTNLTSGNTYQFRINLANSTQSIIFVVGVK